jgi:hypothetical protein
LPTIPLCTRRVNVQLIDCDTGTHLWAERFDKELADLFEMQDDILARLAGQLGAQVIEVEARRGERSPDPDSMDLYFRARARRAVGFRSLPAGNERGNTHLVVLESL